MRYTNTSPEERRAWAWQVMVLELPLEIGNASRKGWPGFLRWDLAGVPWDIPAGISVHFPRRDPILHQALVGGTSASISVRWLARSWADCHARLRGPIQRLDQVPPARTWRRARSGCRVLRKWVHGWPHVRASLTAGTCLHATWESVEQRPPCPVPLIGAYDPLTIIK